jgi:nucleoside-diphosphate-sugar epimerase
VDPLRRILVTGATGQIGSALIPSLRRRFGPAQVIAAGHDTKPCRELLDAGPCVMLEIRDAAAVLEACRSNEIGTVFHLAAILSASAEADPRRAWEVNLDGLRNVLEAARSLDCSVFFPSSIAAFGPGSPLEQTPQDTIQRPLSLYGITKVAGELLCDYYHHRWGVDTRGLRFPGLISHESLPGGGTTDYAVEIFHEAIRRARYTCYLREGTRLDLMYMPDAIRAAMELMEANPGRLAHRNAFNVTAVSAAPEDLAAAIRSMIPEFLLDYRVDPVRQAIAESWPRHLDDSAARAEWGWRPRYDLHAMAQEMLEQIRGKAGGHEP